MVGLGRAPSGCAGWDLPMRLQPANSELGPVPEAWTNKECKLCNSEVARPKPLARLRRHKMGKVGLKNRASTTSSCSAFFRAILRPSLNSRQVAKVCLCVTSCRLGNSPVRTGMWSAPDWRLGPKQSAATGIAEINLCEAPQHPAWNCDGEGQLKRPRNELARGSKPLGPRSRDK